jgi:spore protease
MQKRGGNKVTGRTDMAFEAHQRIKKEGKCLDGIKSELFCRGGTRISKIRVCSKKGEELIGKPMGNYITITAPESWQADHEAIENTAGILGELLSELLPQRGTVLVVGLGNPAITPDSLGPATVDKIIVTRHLLGKSPVHFGGMRSVCAVKAGVLGCTGVETAEIVKGVVDRVSPAAVIAVDALASLSTNRLCRSFQISDTGIVPGSGAYNSRRALDEKTLGVPVIALGVPTVVDADTIVSDALKDSNNTVSAKFPDFLVTPKDIDALIEKCAKVLGYGINIALQGDMSVADMEQFLC